MSFLMKKRLSLYFTSNMLKAYPNVDNVTAYVHGTGCGMADSGDGFEALQRVMWGYAKNPNVAGVLMVGLGCEMNQIDWLVEAYGLKVVSNSRSSVPVRIVYD